ncbi:hypothetical protein DPMN_172641 [Dreissena polymorpha]|uniref:Uncharacterized protein n=1 Tax=Dreissena polymorpha TaxID=45954 RepID=A0A9D4E2Q9_DREPO|nr:hypothetical protein DPMN_172641 [Dreissena polymorpha]
MIFHEVVQMTCGIRLPYWVRYDSGLYNTWQAGFTRQLNKKETSCTLTGHLIASSLYPGLSDAHQTISNAQKTSRIKDELVILLVKMLRCKTIGLLILEPLKKMT